ncbi:histidinol phosphate phosphatase HisJ family protein [Diplocarpon rosae]|nr:histidinol phosphate phosphatase HisJ family protein [Diplocarpon rosae]
MAFSMHGHSGQFCPGHAQDTLEEVVQMAIARGMQIFALTEHMPRNSASDLYPEEIHAGDSIGSLFPRHTAFLAEAVRLRAMYATQITLLVGFEGEWIRPDYGPLIQELAAHPAVDYFIGSVHHVHAIPIDYDDVHFRKARDVAGGTDERLFEDYFDAQLEMLCVLRPRLVGHFDLVRLLSDAPNASLRRFDGVWERVMRNLRLIVEQGGLLEVNSSALRKGLAEPYPMRRVCEEFLKLGGKLTLSDDSHGIEQVGTNYSGAISYLESLGVEELFTLNGKDELSGRPTVSVKRVSLKSVKETFKP